MRFIIKYRWKKYNRTKDKWLVEERDDRYVTEKSYEKILARILNYTYDFYYNEQRSSYKEDDKGCKDFTSYLEYWLKIFSDTDAYRPSERTMIAVKSITTVHSLRDKSKDEVKIFS